GLSIWLKKILPGLVLGVLVGGLLVEFSLLGGTEKSVSYVVTTLSDENYIKIIAFLYLCGGLIGMMNISGGIKGFSKWIGDKIESQRGLVVLIWLTLTLTCVMRMCRIIMSGPVVQSMM